MQRTSISLQRSFYMRALTLVLIVCVLTSLMIVSDAAQAEPAPSPQSLQEDDWWLPAWVEPSDYSGVYGGFNGPDDLLDVEDVKIVWKEVNPEEGVYDWWRLEEALESGNPVWLRFFASDALHVPDWLQEKYPDLRVHRYRWPDGGYDDIVGITMAIARHSALETSMRFGAPTLRLSIRSCYKISSNALAHIPRSSLPT